MTENMTDHLQTLWQDDTQETEPMSLDLIHKRARRQQLFSDIDFYGGCIAGAVFLAIAAWSIIRVGDGPLCLGIFLSSLGVLFLLAWLQARRPIDRKALTGASQACMDFYRHSLRARIDLVKAAWAWQLLPLTPGVVILVVRLHHIAATTNPATHPGLPAARLILLGIEIALPIVAVGLLVYWQVRLHRLKREFLVLENRMTGAN